jgi:outer membrane protein assembly factor BamD
MKQFFIIFLAITCLFFYGCVYVDPDVDKPAHELAQNGMDEFDDGNYKKAIEYFEKVRDWYPFSRHAKVAELKIADAHFRLKDYEEAIVAYETFEELHPKNESIPYVIHQIGLSYFNRLGIAERDQTMAVKAMEVFERLLKSFPDDAYAQDAKEKITLCKKSLAEHDFAVGHFYFRTKHYKAALYRFKHIESSYPEFETAKKASQYSALCEEALAKESEKSDKEE